MEAMPLASPWKMDCTKAAEPTGLVKIAYRTKTSTMNPATFENVPTLPIPSSYVVRLLEGYHLGGVPACATRLAVYRIVSFCRFTFRCGSVPLRVLLSRIG